MNRILMMIVVLSIFVSSAFALDIVAPEAKTYTGDVSLEITHPEKLNRIIYIVDGIEKGSCSNCSELEGTLSLSDGSHILLAYGYLGSEIYSDRVDFTISKRDINLVVDSPLDRTYTSTKVRLDFATDVISNITYQLDSETYTACTNCKSFTDDVTLNYGNHVLLVKARVRTQTDSERVDFRIERSEIGLDVVSPKEKEYDDRDIVLDFRTDKDADITYEIDGTDYEACEDCDRFEKTVRLSEGDHTLEVRAEVGNDYETETVEFSIDEDSTGIGLDVVSPKEEEYSDRDIRLHFTTDDDADITYKIDGISYSGCDDCSKFEKTIRLAEGDHTLIVRAEAGNDYETETVEFSIDEDSSAINLDIVAPVDKEYNTRDIRLHFTTDEKADITYEIDGDDYDACDGCTSFTKTVRLSEGEHTLVVKADSGDDEDTETVEFSIDESASGLEIVSPEAKDYSEREIDVDIRTDEESDIYYYIDGRKYDSCADCTRLRDQVTLGYGWHTLMAIAGTERETVRFRVMTDDENDYGAGFENLPKLLEDGDISDAELARILRENRMPPGIVNRLIKTGKLGDESIDAILSYQFNPPGIMKKFWGWFGWRQMSYSEQIYDIYDVNETHWERMLQRGDLGDDRSEKIKDQLEKARERQQKTWEQARKAQEKAWEQMQKANEKAWENAKKAQEKSWKGGHKSQDD